MKVFAKVFDNRVVKVITAEDDYFETFVDDSPGEWIESSEELTYHTASIGGHYDPDGNAFYDERPQRNGVIFESWSLDENYEWQPPIDYPDNKDYKWMEQTQSWEEVTNGN